MTITNDQINHSILVGIVPSHITPETLLNYSKQLSKDNNGELAQIVLRLAVTTALLREDAMFFNQYRQDEPIRKALTLIAGLMPTTPVQEIESKETPTTMLNAYLINRANSELELAKNEILNKKPSDNVTLIIDLNEIEMKDYLNKSDEIQKPMLNFLVDKAKNCNTPFTQDAILTKLLEFEGTTITPEMQKLIDVAIHHLYHTKRIISDAQKKQLFLAVNCEGSIFSDSLLLESRIALHYLKFVVSECNEKLFQKLKEMVTPHTWQHIVRRNMMMLSIAAQTKSTAAKTVLNANQAIFISTLYHNLKLECRTDFDKAHNIYLLSGNFDIELEKRYPLVLLQKMASMHHIVAIILLLLSQKEANNSISPKFRKSAIYLCAKLYVLYSSNKKELIERYGFAPNNIDLMKKLSEEKVKSCLTSNDKRIADLATYYYLTMMKLIGSEPYSVSDWDAKLLQQVHQDKSITKTLREDVCESVAKALGEISFWGFIKKDWLTKKLAVNVEELKPIANENKSLRALPLVDLDKTRLISLLSDQKIETTNMLSRSPSFFAEHKKTQAPCSSAVTADNDLFSYHQLK